MLTLKNSVISLLLILAISLSSWSIYISKKLRLLTTVDSTQPDTFMENIVATIINDEGKRSLIIESPKMIHYPDNDTTDIQTPHITVFRDSPEPWHINSDYAKATQGINKIFFWSNVIIHHAKDIATTTTTLKTATLTVFPHQQIAKTEDAVTLVQPETTIHAVGMMANLEEGIVKLISQARGEYVPNP